MCWLDYCVTVNRVLGASNHEFARSPSTWTRSQPLVRKKYKPEQ